MMRQAVVGSATDPECMTACGTTRTFRDVRYLVAIGGKDGVIGRQFVDS
jgi:hypothetical protein